MIKFDNVAKRYPTGHEGLSGVDLHIEPGEMAFLTGHSGAGKSTLLKLIGLLERATRGQVWVNGRNLNKLRARDIPYHRREVGMIFQDHRLLHDRTVFDNIALPMVVAGMGHAEVTRRVRAALDKVGLLKKEKVFPITLSGGEQQRVGIARALVSKPPVLLADEPTGNLDQHSGLAVIDALEALNARRITLIVVTHDAAIGRRAGRQIKMVDGRITADRSNHHAPA